MVIGGRTLAGRGSDGRQKVRDRIESSRVLDRVNRLGNSSLSIADSPVLI